MLLIETKLLSTYFHRLHGCAASVSWAFYLIFRSVVVVPRKLTKFAWFSQVTFVALDPYLVDRVFEKRLIMLCFQSQAEISEMETRSDIGSLRRRLLAQVKALLHTNVRVAKHASLVAFALFVGAVM